MSVTTVHVPSVPTTSQTWLRRQLVWLLVGAAVLATAVLAVLVLDPTATDRSSSRGTAAFDADRGSIAAIDHGATSQRSAVAVPESITAIDHRAGAASPRSAVALPESITAIDHRAGATSPASMVLPESIAAIDHRAEAAGR
jgi:hypothetical protein